MTTYNSKGARLLRGVVKARRSELSVFDKHQLKIARDTLRMSDVGAMIMGGMDKDTARSVIFKLTGVVAAREG